MRNMINPLKRNFLVKVIVLIFFLSCLITFNSAQAFELEDKVTTYTLDNGLEVIMVENGAAPIVHFRLMFDVGGVDEPEGLGGIAHMVEHMAFKGTTSLGTDDWSKEEELLEKLDQAAEAYFQAQADDLSEQELEQLEDEFQAAQAQAQEVAEPNSLMNLFDGHGARNYNAKTGYDYTSYHLTLPSNRLELFARVKADVIDNAVFRYFYEEVDVVKEERRQRNEDEPTGFLQEHFLDEAFTEHFYGRPLIGSMEEIENYRRQVALDFWDAHYHPNRAVLVMAGDLNPSEDIEIIKEYFSEISAGPVEKTEIPEEPEQTEERRRQVTFDAEPQMFIGFHKPTYPEPDAYVLDAVSAVLGSGRTSRLHRRLITEEEVAVSVNTYSSIPGNRYSNLFGIHVVTRDPYTPEDVEEIIYEEIEKLKEEQISQWELEKVRNQVRASYIRNLDSTEGLASQLAYYQLFLDGWENITKYPDKIVDVTAEELQMAVQNYLVEDNRTVAILKAESGGE